MQEAVVYIIITIAAATLIKLIFFKNEGCCGCKDCNCEHRDEMRKKGGNKCCDKDKKDKTE